jgi:hypothetical protein
LSEWAGEEIGVKYTQYFLHTRKRPDRSRIKEAWIRVAVESPVAEEGQSDGRIRKWTWVEEERKFLRVILLEDGETVHNAFFDQAFTIERKEGFEKEGK